MVLWSLHHSRKNEELRSVAFFILGVRACGYLPMVVDYVRFGVLTVKLIKVAVSHNILSDRLVYTYQHFRGNYCLCLQTNLTES
jgi:ABC-type thiamin/hydroxymethylpyrimidine transport system permease subunit